MNKKIKASDIVFSPKTSKKAREFFKKKPAPKKEPAAEPSFKPWAPEDGVIFPKLDPYPATVDALKAALKGKYSLLDHFVPLTEPIPDSAKPENFDHPASEVLDTRFPQLRDMSEFEHPTEDARHVAALKIQARRGEKSAQQELTERFGPMHADWSGPLPPAPPGQPRMNFWQRILFVFKGYND